MDSFIMVGSMYRWPYTGKFNINTLCYCYRCIRTIIFINADYVTYAIIFSSFLHINSQTILSCII